MKRNEAQGRPSERRVVTAANEEFSAAVSAVRETASAQSGWDPYEVWATRVKAPALLKRARQRNSSPPG